MSNFNQRATFTFPVPVYYGCGVLDELGERLGQLGCKRPLVVSGPSVAGAGLVDRAMEPISKIGIEATLFLDAGLNPSEKDVYRGVECFRQGNADSIVAIGGGSRIDLAKAIRLMVSHPGSLSSYYFDVGGVERIRKPMPPLVAIPTTAGSGSEVSRGAIITDSEQNRKRLIAGPGITASAAILDPELTTSMSPSLTATAGVDALSHALETFVGTSFHPLVEGISCRAAELILSDLELVVADGNDLDRKGKILLASTMAAMGFAKGLGVVHALAHQLTPIHNISHGLAIAIILPHGMRYNLTAATESYADLSRKIGVGDSGDDRTAAECLIDAVSKLVQRVGLPTTLRDVGVSLPRIEVLARQAMLDHCVRTNPRPCTLEDMERILQEAA
ncbi:MAG: iron-containing alcohol dehydrogenase [Candidatus Latescibacteria bacterium]|nr:iron-containing alcohol dehydrogenase [Candidatus Latescibacterota bacterium]